MSEQQPPPSYQPYPTGPPPPSPPGEVQVVSLGAVPPARRRAPVAIALLIGLALVIAAVALPVALRGGQPADLGDVVVADDLSNAHVSGDESYPTTPPIGGPHDEEWLDCGVYDEPVRDENAVHDLEHGTVWITYEPGLSDGDVERLADLLPQNGILSPYDGLPAPVVVTVWGRQLRLEGADDERLELFLDRYVGGVTAPEPMASCAGGTRDPSGSGGTTV